jgi:hypothetical protein
MAHEKKLDTIPEFAYSPYMICANTLIFKLALKAAWRRTAVVEGGFY